MARTGVTGSGSKMDDVVEENRNHKHAKMVIQEINLSLMYYFPYYLHFSLLMETAEIHGTGWLHHQETTEKVDQFVELSIVFFLLFICPISILVSFALCFRQVSHSLSLLYARQTRSPSLRGGLLGFCQVALTLLPTWRLGLLQGSPFNVGADIWPGQFPAEIEGVAILGVAMMIKAFCLNRSPSPTMNVTREVCYVFRILNCFWGLRTKCKLMFCWNQSSV